MHAGRGAQPSAVGGYVQCSIPRLAPVLALQYHHTLLVGI